VSVSITSSIFRALQQLRQDTTAPVAPQSTPAAAPSAPQAPATPVSFQDGFEQASTQQQEWAAKFSADALPPSGSAPVLRQTSDDNCGAAAAVMAAGSRGQVAGVSAEERMSQLESQFTSGNGTSAQQMAKMLGSEGMQVNQAAFKFDQTTVDDTLKKGGKLMAMVDSAQITPGSDPSKTGGAHWVVVDGKDDKGNYTVKDPATGSSYGVDFNHLTNAVDQNWFKHNSGGMMLVEDAKGGASAAALAQANADKAVTLNGNNGGGSKGAETFGRESP
jgi:hypothetical protein